MEEIKRQAWNEIGEQLAKIAKAEPTKREQYMVAAVCDLVWGNPELYVSLSDST